MTREETKVLLQMIAATWANFKHNAQTEKAWTSPLKNVSFDDCKTALQLYQQPRNDEEARRCAFAPHPGDIYNICREIEAKRVEVRSFVASCARRAVDNFPSNGEEERDEAKEIFVKMCMEQKDPRRTAALLERELDGMRETAEHYRKNRLRPVTEIIKEAPVYDK